MLIETISTRWKKALLQGNSVQQSFWTPALLQGRPDSAVAGLPVSASGVSPDGIWAAAGTPPGMFTNNRVQLMPWADGGLGLQFSLRMWGFTQHGGDTNPYYLPTFLAEFLCTISQVMGVYQYNADDPLGTSFPVSAALCDTVTLTQGGLGITGEINSTGPGTNIPAWMTVEIKGAQWFFFDFQNIDGSGGEPPLTFGANCFWKFV